ncbi:MAG: DUF3574 domain-containing protein [Caulobacteraceae bacterium]|nr:DUF3574 domain-containing protein [Caulobacteraceae bacterium]
MRGSRARAGMRAAALLLALAASAGRAGAPVPHCGGGSQRPTAELVFGRAGADGVAVSEAEFSRFLDQEVSPRFPDGLTVVDAQGRWTPPAGVSIHEPSKMVMLVLRGAPDEQARLDAVREAYKRRYNQQSVLLMTSSACVSF